MQKYVYTALLLSITLLPVNGLKLLEKADVTEDDDDTWEAEISFSYKPFKGKCDNKADGSGSEPGQTPTSHGYSSPNGEVTNRQCTTDTVDPATIPAAVVAKYCTSIFANVNQVKQKLAAAKDEKGKAGWTTKTFIHYAAMYATISNSIVLKEATAADATWNLIKAFTLDTSNWATKFYKDVAKGGTTASADASKLCFTEVGIAWAKNDPIVKNVDGQEFEIMATGTFSLLTVKGKAARTVFEASATIDRAGTRCGATYIQNITLTGQWVEDIGVPRIQVKAEAAVPKLKALQVNFDGEWHPVSLKSSYPAMKVSSATELALKLSHLTVKVSVDSHRIHEKGVRTKRFANFLNVNFGGISSLGGLSLGGLLGRDSHEEAAALPDGCENTLLASENDDGQKMWSYLDIQ